MRHSVRYRSRLFEDPDALKATYGFSKNTRPDLRQVIGRMLCAGGDIQIIGGANDGNECEKKIG